MYAPPLDITMPSYEGAKLSRFQVERVMQIHELWRHGSTAPGQRAHFAYADLSGLDLSGIDFSMASFEYANLANVNFTGCNLARNSFRHSDCSGADFSNTELEYSNFMMADLTGINLTNATFCNTIGNGKQIKNFYVAKFLAAYTSERMVIGCMDHSIQWYKDCTLADIQDVYNAEDSQHMLDLIKGALTMIDLAPCIPVIDNG